MKLRHLALPAILASALGHPAAIASPAIHGVLVDPASETLVVLGHGFGEKPQAAPVLFDFGGHAYENGQLNDFHSTHYENGQNMRPTFMDSNMRVYDLMARTPRNTGQDPDYKWGDNGPIYVSHSSQQRHPDVGALYRMRSGARIGQPMAYGGYDNAPDRRFDQPDGNRQIYVAWWGKHWIHYDRIRALRLTNIQGEFQVSEDGWTRGERFSAVGTTWDGYVVGWWEGGFNDSSVPHGLWLDVEGDTTRTGLVGVTITGVESGATAEIEALSSYTTSQKWARVWTGWPGNCLSQGGTDTRSRAALAVFGMGHECAPSGGLMWHGHTTRDAILAGEWHLFEWYMDNDAGEMRFKIDGKFMCGHRRAIGESTCPEGILTFDPEHVDQRETGSPTLHTLGMDTNQWGRQTLDISEIYMDSTLQRVLVADAPNLADATHLELQRPVSWVDDRVAFELRLGALHGTRTPDQLYVFVFDRNGKANREGILLPADAMGLLEPLLLPPNPVSVN